MGENLIQWTESSKVFVLYRIVSHSVHRAKDIGPKECWDGMSGDGARSAERFYPMFSFLGCPMNNSRNSLVVYAFLYGIRYPPKHFG